LQRRSLGLLAGGLVATALLSSTPAWAATKYQLVRELSSTPAGGFENPDAVAVAQTFGETYVVDRGRRVVDEFGSSGLFVSELTGTPASAPVSGPFGDPTGVAVDGSGDAFVVDAENRVVDEFNSSGAFVRQISEAPASAPVGGPFGGLNGSVAVDESSGDLYVGDSGNKVVDEFSPTGVFVRQLLGTPPGAPVSGPFGSVRSVAVSGTGELYVGDNEGKVVDEFDSSGGFVRQLSGTPAGAPVAGAFGNPRALAVDQTSRQLFVADNGVSPPVVDQFDASGAFQAQLALAGSNPIGLAVDGSGEVYVADNETRAVKVFAREVVPDVNTGAASNTAETSATLTGTVNPAGVPVTSCEFEYGTTGEYGSTVPCVQSPAEIGSGTGNVSVSAGAANLQPRKVYHFRLLAANTNGSNHGADQTFTTVTPPVVEDESVSNVGAGAATLVARINAGGLETSYSFEYGTTVAYGTSLPVPSAGVGHGLAGEAVSVNPHGLRPGTPYHFRVLASNAAGSVQGPDRAFTTQPAGGEPFALPDGRAWEMISPPEKHGGVIQTLSPGFGGLVQASANGGAITYLSSQSLIATPEGESNLSQVLSTRTAGGWSSQDIATPHRSPSDANVGLGSEYRFFSADLSHALVEPFGESPTPLSAQASERTPYLRDNQSASYLPLLTAADAPPGTRLGGNPESQLGPVQVVDATPDLSRVVLHTTEGVALTATPVEAGLYEWAAGTIELVSALPAAEGGAAVNGLVGDVGNNVRHAISDDGSRIFWTRRGTVNHLYMRDVARAETIQVDTVQPGGPGSGEVEPHFQTASSDGSRVLFTDEQALTEGSGAAHGKADLYECDVAEAAGKLVCRIRDLTATASPGESAEVQGILLGAGEDASCVYFVAHGVLSSAENPAHEKAAAGQNNLYLERFDGKAWAEPTFIASLSSEDRNDWQPAAPGDLRHTTSRVSPNGRYLAFMSQRSLTGYDNADASSGQLDEEVFLYDASRNRLLCASCDPTGARPQGRFDSPEQRLLVDNQQAWGGHWLAASIPTWQWKDGQNATYQSRYLLNNGRLFFNSPGDLLPQAVNGQQDVYQYEPAGVGGCTGSSETFDPKTGGCLGLISSGSANGESVFLEASESGADVFLLTPAQLAPQDADDQGDVYDAHECTSSSPCLTPPAGGSSPPCTTGEACRPAVSPEPSAFEAPASATFPGAADTAGDATVKGKPLTRAQKLARALQSCRRKPNRERARCRAAARRRYGIRADRRRSVQKVGR
jgi:hypothetical protein